MSTKDDRAAILAHWLAVPDADIPRGIVAAMRAAPGAPEEWQAIADMLAIDRVDDWLPSHIWATARRAYLRGV